jgi:GNAT superfamily N-acetyltransferase
MDNTEYRIEPALSEGALNDLFHHAWEQHKERQFGPVLEHSLTYVGAFDGGQLVGFVNVAWDGGIHGFILDTTVHQDYQRRGIGTELLKRATGIAAQRGIEWLHVDYEPRLQKFYSKCGYENTEAGLLKINGRPGSKENT